MVTESERLYNKQYRLKNLEKFIAYRKQYYQKTRQKSIETAIKWNKDNADKVRIRARLKYRRNVQKIRKHRRQIRLDLLNNLGDRCFICGYDENELALQIDHVDGTGATEKKRFKSNTTLYRYYLKHLDLAKSNLQVLCANCNTVKRFEKREINHKFG